MTLSEFISTGMSSVIMRPTITLVCECTPGTGNNTCIKGVSGGCIGAGGGVGVPTTLAVMSVHHVFIEGKMKCTAMVHG